LSLEEAVEKLGMTVNAVRQRVDRGTVHDEKTTAGLVVFLSTAPRLCRVLVVARPTNQQAHSDQGPTDHPTTPRLRP
jgi:hypothetical protein